jgi:TatD DNase family protein
MRLIDTHCHLNTTAAYPDLGEVLARAREAGVEKMLVVGIDRGSTPEALRFAIAYSEIYAIVGVHPNSAAGFGDREMAEVREWLQAPKTVGIGETGLDYHHQDASKDDQARAFEWHLDLAAETGLPLSIHCREAYDDLLAILERRGGPYRGVLHCFGGTVSHAERAITLGFHLGVDGPVTYKKADDLREVIRQVPLDRLLLETDCPYLPPVPHRGKRNEPSYLPLIAQAVADARAEPLETVAEATTRNAINLFGL